MCIRDSPSTLYAVTDRTGWWNLVRLALDGGAPEPLHGGEEEFGAPLWQLGQTTYALLDDGRLAVTHGVGRAALGVLDPVSYTHLRAHETVLDLVCRLLLEK